MGKVKNLYNKTKSGIKKTLITYCVLGSLVGFKDSLIGDTTGHHSSDIYLGKKEPAKIEKIICKKIFNVNLECKLK